MLECCREDNYVVRKETIVPAAVKDSRLVENAEELLVPKRTCVSFENQHVARFTGKGAYVVLDYAKELCGGIRLITPTISGVTKVRITLGESLSECYSSIGEKNATNDHSPRDFEAELSNLSDLVFGQSGFRFAKIELLTETPVLVRSIFAVNTLPVFEKEGYIKTSDSRLNEIIDTAIYTLKLNFQNGYIWDGIKRDRLVWCGDLHQEILNGIYLFGDNQNITNSLSVLREETPVGKWINDIPTYSAWWVLNLCNYCSMTGNEAYFQDNRDYAKSIMKQFDEKVSEEGVIDFQLDPRFFMCYFLDWPTYRTDDAVISTASLIMLTARNYLVMEEDEHCRSLLKKLEHYLNQPCQYKQTRALQILAGRKEEGDAAFLEQGGADGFSTFMAYYILKADAMAGGDRMMEIIKEYFGAMLSRGATTFWEDFHMDWLQDSGRIDELPAEGQKDLHGDFGDYCYKGFRHSLCHGWSSGVLSFIVEYMLGLKLTDGGKSYEITPHMMGVEEMEAKIPISTGWLHVQIKDGKVTAKEQ